MGPEMHLDGEFSGEKYNIEMLKAQLRKMTDERDSLGQIDAAQLTEVDIDRMAELDENIISLNEMLKQIEESQNKESGVQNLGDTIH